MRYRRPHWGQIVVVAVHTALVAAVAILVATSEDFPETEMVWLMFLAIDFPVSLLGVIPLDFVVNLVAPSIQDTVSTNLQYAASFGVLGGLQYYWLSGVIIRWWKRRD